MDILLSHGLSKTNQRYLNLYHKLKDNILLLVFAMMYTFLKSNSIHIIFIFFLIGMLLFFYLIGTIQIKMIIPLQKRCEVESYYWVIDQGITKEELIANFVNTYKFKNNIQEIEFDYPHSLQETIHTIHKL